MITRTSIGADFEGALSYGAGLNQRGAAKKAELLGSSNLGDVSNPRGLAAEMQSVAEENTRCKNPVWHTSLSWAEGEQLSRAQKLQAAQRYCELMGASWDAHQVAVYEHHDKKHEHIHIYFNRVPVLGGPAVDTGHNYARNLKAIKTITQELGLTPLPGQRQSLQDRRPPVQDTRQVVRAALVAAMADPQVQSLDQLQERLAAQGIEARLKRSQAGELVGVSFRQGEAAVTGQEVGMKAAQLRAHYEPRQAQGQEQAPPSFQLAELSPAELAQIGLSVAQLEATGQLQKLLRGERTDLLPMQGGTRVDTAPILFEGRLLLQRAENGAVTLKVALPRRPAVQQVSAHGSPASEQRPMAIPPIPERKPPLPAPTVQPELPKPDPPKRKGPRLR